MTIEPTTVELPADAPCTTARRGYDRAEVDQFVDATRLRLQSMADRLGEQQADLERLESENRSYSRSIDIAMKAAGEVMEEATAAAEATVAEAEQRATSMLETADEQAVALVTAADEIAAETRAEAEVQALEIVTVARADATDAVEDERTRISAELEMVDALQRKLAKERQSLVALRDQLTTRLLDAGRYLTNLAEDPLRHGQEILDEQLIAPSEAFAADPIPATAAAAEVAEEIDELVSETATAAADEPVAGDDLDTEHHDDHEFFSAEVEEEPSRRWILG